MDTTKTDDARKHNRDDMRVKKYNLYNITSLYVIQVSDSQGIFIDYNMLFSISTLVSSIDLQLTTIIICCDYVAATYT
jgi:hypothetical protein